MNPIIKPTRPNRLPSFMPPLPEPSTLLTSILPPSERPPNQYSTLTRYNPLAGAVAPAAERLRASKIRMMSSGDKVPLPTSTDVPTKFRTIW